METLKNYNEKEQKIFTLCVVKSCMEYAAEKGSTFEEVLFEELFEGEPNAAFTDMILYNIKCLKDEGYLDGEVELGYDSFEEGENPAEGISIMLSEVDNISITEKGNTYIKSGDLGVKMAELKEKAIPALKYVGSIALQTAIEIGMTKLLV